jgi:hypothetical protein
LVETLTSNVSSEFERLLADNLAQVVRPLEGIPYLRQFAFSVVANRKSTTQLNEREAFVLGSQVRMNSERILWGPI